MTSLLDDTTMSWVGRTVTAAPYPVARADIARFALAIGARDPVHFDAGAAKREGHPDVVAPLGFYVAIRLQSQNLVPLDELNADGVSPGLTPPSRASKIMAGDTRARFHRRIRAGDVITLTTSISGIQEKRGRSGPLILVSYSLEYTDQFGEAVVSETYARVLR
ncbi:FAS1-like dehydratase domain-containing protein [Actinomadura latina]|uniref:MaoC family dehydratase n=1 Tax=Actinomadura latina TaxID=163603 RepID=A0A846Z751_9ACTN|nr:MaoC family dehydratase N-terminal domain-containing protein [Actinomadura latina]NKZ06478.1 MaoC family dehydratase [Actinomadura latina]